MKIAIDTNIYTEFARGTLIVRDVIANAEHVYISAIVVGELIFGFRNGSRFQENQQVLELFLSESIVTFLPVTLETCKRFGMIATELKKAGTPIPQNDIWIAAHAMEHGTELLSFDHHFQKVNGLMFTLLNK